MILHAVNKSNPEVHALVAQYLGSSNSIAEVLKLWDAYIREEEYQHTVDHVVDLKRDLVLFGVVHARGSNLEKESIPMDCCLMIVYDHDPEGRVRYNYCVSVKEDYSSMWEVTGGYEGL
jgi:hypothetical protein